MKQSHTPNQVVYFTSQHFTSHHFTFRHEFVERRFNSDWQQLSVADCMTQGGGQAEWQKPSCYNSGILNNDDICAANVKFDIKINLVCLSESKEKTN
jgi:hypothetical protein